MTITQNNYPAFVSILIINVSSVQSLSRVQLFVTPWTVAHQASLSITNSRSLLKLTSIKSVMPSNPLILYLPLDPWTVALQAPGPWDSPGKNTGTGCHALLQGIFPTQGWNPGLLHC